MSMGRTGVTCAVWSDRLPGDLAMLFALPAQDHSLQWIRGAERGRWAAWPLPQAQPGFGGLIEYPSGLDSPGENGMAAPLPPSRASLGLGQYGCLGCRHPRLCSTDSPRGCTRRKLPPTDHETGIKPKEWHKGVSVGTACCLAFGGGVEPLGSCLQVCPQGVDALSATEGLT